MKDASAYNVQFLGGHPIFIDTLSFDHYREGDLWVAYRQFCQHFLAPLALMANMDIRLSQWMRLSIDGIPLDLASRLLPGVTRFKPSLAMHIHLHGRSQQKYADRPGGGERIKQRKISRQGLLGILKSLQSAVRSLRWTLPQTEWGEYYDATNYTSEAMQHKRELVADFLRPLSPGTVWDLGANTGEFSRLASDQSIRTVAFDIDPVAVEKNYLMSRERKEKHLLPLLQDLTNPSPGLGWHGNERKSLIERGPADVVFALALVHHLAISNNVPLPKIANFFADITKSLIIEFIPKSDSQVKRLLSTREDIFPNYTRDGFERAFETRFRIEKAEAVRGSERHLYLMRTL